MKETLYKCDCLEYSCTELNSTEIEMFEKEGETTDLIEGRIKDCLMFDSVIKGRNNRYFLRPVDNQDDDVIDLVVR